VAKAAHRLIKNAGAAGQADAAQQLSSCGAGLESIHHLNRLCQNCGIICAAERVTQRGYHFLPGMLHQTCARLHEIGMRRACAALGQDGGANLWAGALKPVDA
jgi:hypothetical protein